jgi:hypothetical protein
MMRAKERERGKRGSYYKSTERIHQLPPNVRRVLRCGRHFESGTV